METRGRRQHAIPVAHPADELRVQGREQIARRKHVHLGAAEFGMVRRLHVSAQGTCHELHAVADAKHGDAQLEHRGIDARRAFGIHARRPPAQDDSVWIDAPQFLGGDGVREYFAVNVALTNPPRDKLVVLRAKIQHRDKLSVLFFFRLRH